MTRPDILNPLSTELRADFVQLVDTIAAFAGHDHDHENRIRALVIMSEGKVFSAGGDVKMMAADKVSPAGVRSRITSMHSWFERLIDLEVPVIVAVDGPVFGAGFSLALAADFIVATPQARFCCVFNRIGLIPDMGIIHALPRRIGLARAKELMYSARSFKAEEARSLGLVLDIVKRDDLQDHAGKLGLRFGHASSVSLALTKRLANKTFDVDYKTMAELEAAAQTICVESDYHRTAVQRFVNKEAALFDWDAFDREDQ